MYKAIKCERCGNTLDFVRQDNIQFGKESMFFDRDYSKGHLPVDIYICPECEEYHFIKTQPCKKEELVKCKWCCQMVDPSYPFCPECGHKPGDI